MEVFAQGIVGKMDLFIHPNYVSAVYPMEEAGYLALFVLILGFVVFAIAILLFEKRWRERKALEDSERPPPVR